MYMYMYSPVFGCAEPLLVYDAVTTHLCRGLICLHIDVGKESKSILLFCSFHIISLYGAYSQMDETDGSLRNEMK